MARIRRLTEVHPGADRLRRLKCLVADLTLDKILPIASGIGGFPAIAEAFDHHELGQSFASGIEDSALDGGLR